LGIPVIAKEESWTRENMSTGQMLSGSRGVLAPRNRVEPGTIFDPCWLVDLRHRFPDYDRKIAVYSGSTFECYIEGSGSGCTTNSALAQAWSYDSSLTGPVPIHKSTGGS